MDPGSYIAIVDMTAKVVTLAFKTKQLWDQVKDVPAEIQDLLQELRLTARLFGVLRSQMQIASTLGIPWDENVMLDCLDSAMTAQCSLEGLFLELERQLRVSRKGFRHLIAAKFVMKKDVVQKLKERLNASVRLLQLSHQILSMQLLPDLTAARVAITLAQALKGPDITSEPQSAVPALLEGSEAKEKQINASITESDEDPSKRSTAEYYNRGGQCIYPEASEEAPHDSANRTAQFWPSGHHQTWELSYHGRVAIALSQGSKPSSIYLQMPRWWSSAVWEFFTTPSVSGSGFQYRVYNMRRSESSIFQHVKRGEIGRVQEMLSTGQASCLDIDEDGNSLLFHATYAGQSALASLFTSFYNMHPFYETNEQSPGWTPLDILITRHWSGVSSKPAVPCVSLTRIFQPYLAGSEGELVTRVLVLLSRPYSDNALLFCLKGFLMNYRNIAINERLKFVRQGVYCVHKPSTLWTLLGVEKDSSIEDLGSDTVAVGHSLLHSAALTFGFRGALQLNTRERCGQKRSNRKYLEWIQFASRLTAMCANKTIYDCRTETIELVGHRCVPKWTGTPLITLLGGILCNVSPINKRRGWGNMIYRSLQVWLHALKAAGVDLVRYGALERTALQSLKAALGSEALEAARNTPWGTRHAAKGTNAWSTENYVPLRIIDLRYSANVREWEIVWAPEYEWMAMEFWIMVDSQRVMPGTWVDN